jgi:hypothetical protein
MSSLFNHNKVEPCSPTPRIPVSISKFFTGNGAVTGHTETKGGKGSTCRIPPVWPPDAIHRGVTISSN